jgi:hypothetical protein
MNKIEETEGKLRFLDRVKERADALMSLYDGMDGIEEKGGALPGEMALVREARQDLREAINGLYAVIR